MMVMHIHKTTVMKNIDEHHSGDDDNDDKHNQR